MKRAINTSNPQDVNLNNDHAVSGIHILRMPPWRDYVFEFCRSIVPGTDPVILPIKPNSYCRPQYCFQNVQQKVQCDGGRIQFGWAIWEWPRVFIEAEHHAVYSPADGTVLIDITPSAYPQDTKRLFLPDDSAVYRFDGERTHLDNIRFALTDDPLVKEYFRVAIVKNKIMNTVSGDFVVLEGEASEYYIKAEQVQLLLTYQLIRKYVNKNDQCYCGSGKKLKMCHWRNITR